MILHYFHFVITIIQDQIRDYLLTWSIRKNELIYQFNPKAQIYGFIVGSGLRGPFA